MTIEVKKITEEHELESIVADINKAVWDEDNDVSQYGVGALQAYLQRQDTVLVVAYEKTDSVQNFLGMASARLEMKPYDNELWLYVDEVDVCVDQRKKGAGKALMNKLLEIADQEDCEELWLGTEVDNDAANALYKSLDPDDIGQVVGYTYEMDD